MKNLLPVVGTGLPMVLGLMLAVSGCSSMKSGMSGEELAASGPTVVQAKAEPGTIELDQSLNAKAPARVFADVKDFSSDIQDVRLRFVHVPLELRMKKLSGTTWEAQLNADQLKKLAVSGETMRYQAEVIAKNAKGQIATSREPVEIAVKAPEPRDMRA